MRNFWLPFIAGVFLVGLGGWALRAQRANSEDPRIQQINDPSISGLKTQVPNPAEMDKAIATRERELEEKDRRLQETERRLQAEEDRIKARIDELQAMQESVAKLNEKVEITDKEVLAKMVKTFEKMAPKKAAGVMSTMDETLAVELLMAMKEKNVAQVFEAMEPDRATKLSSLMAARRPAGRIASGVQARAPSPSVRKPGSLKKGGEK